MVVPPMIGPFGGDSTARGGGGLHINFEEGDGNDYGVRCACIVETIKIYGS